MDHMRALGLLDSTGKPLGDRIEHVVIGLLPKLRRRFPTLQDEVALTEVLEEAGRRIANREERGGPLEHLHGYAWVTMRSVATSYLRRPSTRLINDTLESEASQARIAMVSASYGSAESIERAILVREAMEELSEEERLVCTWKTAGFSALEIARFLGRSVVAVDTLFSRAKAKLRTALSPSHSEHRAHDQAGPTNDRTYERARRREDQTERSDGQHPSGAGKR